MLKIKVHISNWGGRHTCPSAPPGQKQHSTWLFLTNTGHTTPHHTHTHQVVHGSDGESEQSQEPLIGV